MPDELPDLLSKGFDRLFGLEVTEVGDGVMCGKVPVRDEIKQAAGLLHGGVYAAMAESLASMGTWLAVIEQGKIAMGLSNQTSFIRPATEGEVHGRARAMHRGRTTWVWEVEMTDDGGRLCALTRVTVAVRDAPASVQLSG